MASTILYNENARNLLEIGMDVIAEAISITIGPKGRNVVLEKRYAIPQIVNDGVTIAKEINLKEKLKNTGVSLIRQAASKTNDVAGDGTTTATVIAYAIIKQGMRNVTAGANPIVLKRGIKKSTKFVISKINQYARSISDVSDIKKVAMISSGNDLEIGLLIANAVDKVGRQGLISLEEGKSIKTELEITRGMSFNRGFISAYFTSANERQEIILENPYILMTDQKITLVKRHLLPALELISKTNRSLLIIADDVQKEALATLIVNKMQGRLDVVAVKAPGFGEVRKSILEDLSILVAGQVISSNSGLSLEKIQLKSLGEARRVVIKKESTTLISLTNKKQVLRRCEQIRRQLETSDSTYEKENLQERLAKLSSGVALIKVGASTETELKDRKLRLEDAINATKAAVEEGIVPGGGTALAYLAKEVRRWAFFQKFQEDELIGSAIVRKSLEAPLKRIVFNTGKNGAVVAERIKNNKFKIGYNAATNRIVNMYTAGIMDPAKVTRSALQNAASIASMILTTECVIIDNQVI